MSDAREKRYKGTTFMGNGRPYAFRASNTSEASSAIASRSYVLCGVRRTTQSAFSDGVLGQVRAGDAASIQRSLVCERVMELHLRAPARVGPASRAGTETPVCRRHRACR